MSLESKLSEAFRKAYDKIYDRVASQQFPFRVTVGFGALILPWAIPAYLFGFLISEASVWDFTAALFMLILITASFDVHNIHKRVSYKENYRLLHKACFWALIGALLSGFIGASGYYDEIETFKGLTFQELLELFANALLLAPIGALIAILILAFRELRGGTETPPKDEENNDEG